VVPGLVNKRYDRGPFKLICDDLGLANLIVKSEKDFTVVGVIDLEWSYAGPAQLCASAPWWLLIDSPLSEDWDHFGKKPPTQVARYFRYLKIYQRVLEEEESKRPAHKEKELSTLVRWSEESGAMWLHMVLSNGFICTHTFPSERLQQHLRIGRWRKGEGSADTETEKAFAVQKMSELEQHKADLAEIRADKARMDRGEIYRQDFIDKYRRN
jgi:hypothetical protein